MKLLAPRLFEIPWTVALQAPLSMGFPRQEHWSELPFPSPGALPDPGMEPTSPALTGGVFTAEALGSPSSGRQTVTYVSGSGSPVKETAGAVGFFFFKVV